MAVCLASHCFDSGPLGNCCSCVRTRDGETYVCNRRLVDILGVTEADIDQEGIACYGKLTRGEYEGIVAYRERLWCTLEHP